MIRRFSEVIERAVALPDRHVAVACAEHDEVLRAVEDARRLDIASSILVGDADAVRRELRALGLDPARHEIIHARTPEEAAATAVRLVAEGQADTLMKGLLDTNILLHAVLDHDHGLRAGGILSHVGLIETDRYPKLLAITDGGLVIAPDLDTKERILRNALVVTRALGIETAKVAVVAAKEKVTPRMPATVDAAALAARPIEGAIVAGPLAVDNAIDPASAALKGVCSPVAGDADVLLMPSIEAGNVCYKTLMFLGRALGAGLVVGGRRPMVVTSRADDELTRLHSIALAVLVAAVQAEDAAASGAAATEPGRPLQGAAR